MSDKKPDLFTIEHALYEKYPDEVLEKYAVDIKNGDTPSNALKKFINKNNCAELDSSIIFELIKRAYPGIDLSHLTGQIHDSGYPFGDPNDMNDERFDELVIDAWESPAEW